MSTTAATYRYPGVKPFEASDAPLFFGRDRDRADLLDLVNRETLAVLFAKSGYGKSSLIKAAVIPELLAKPDIRPDPTTGEDVEIPNCPIYIRLNLFNAGKSPSPCEVVAARFAEAFAADGKAAGVASFFKEKSLGDRLYNKFRASRTAVQKRIFLIFDQFEEFFSYPAEAQLQFRQELSELLYTQIPQAVRDAMEGLDRAAKRHLHQPMEIHALFAVRADRLHLLNGLREELPAILQVRYELKALSEKQAEEAIVRPAALDRPGFAVEKPFGYEPAALSKIISELKKNRDPNALEFGIEQPIESFQLQMVCQTIEQGIVSRTRQSGEQPTVIGEADLPDFEQIYNQYYTDKLADLPTSESRDAAHLLLEEEMVIGEELAEMRRVSLPKEVLVKAMHDTHGLTVEQPLFDYLEDRFLIRRETFGPNVHYEVSHDVLLGPLMKARNTARALKAELAALAAESKRREEQLARQQEAELEARARREKEVNEAKRKQLIGGLMAAVMVVILLAWMGLEAWSQKKEADLQKKKAETALAALQAIQQEKEKGAFYRTLYDISVILSVPDACPDRNQLTQLDTFPRRVPGDAELQRAVEATRRKLKEKKCQ